MKFLVRVLFPVTSARGHIADASVGRDGALDAKRQFHHPVMEFAQAWPVPDADEGNGQARKSRVQALFRSNIESAGRLVENCKARSTEQEPCKGQTLLLALFLPKTSYEREFK